MRILHTADWHMNSTLGRQNLSGLIVAALEKIAVYLDEYQVDVLVVAGDLFSERSRDEGMREAIAQIRRVFGAFVARGGKILAIAGNHDSPLRFETLRDALKLGAGQDAGRFILAASPDFVTLSGTDGQRVQFALLPYPTPATYLPGVTFTSLEEKNRLVQAEFAATLESIRRDQVDPSLPAVLVSHVHVRGAGGHTLYKVSEADDVVFEPSQISAAWTYAAYGHIHKPGEAVPGIPHIRYSGSVVPLDAAERFDSKGVVLVDIDAAGTSEIRILPLPSVPLFQIVFDFVENEVEAELAKWLSRVPDPQNTLVHYTLRYQPEKHSLGALRAEIDRLFPLWYGRNDEKVGLEFAPRPLELVDENQQVANPLSGDVPSLVRSFLAQRLENNADREAVFKLAEELLAAR
jgi:exonuclease SbcD